MGDLISLDAARAARRRRDGDALTERVQAARGLVVIDGAVEAEALRDLLAGLAEATHPIPRPREGDDT